MSTPPRQYRRLILLRTVLRELLDMETELYRTLSEWTISVGILYLILEGQIGGTAGVMGVTILMSVDVARLYTIYKEVETGEKELVDSP